MSGNRQRPPPRIVNVDAVPSYASDAAGTGNTANASAAAPVDLLDDFEGQPSASLAETTESAQPERSVDAAPVDLVDDSESQPTVSYAESTGSAQTERRLVAGLLFEDGERTSFPTTFTDDVELLPERDDLNLINENWEAAGRPPCDVEIAWAGKVLATHCGGPHASALHHQGRAVIGTLLRKWVRVKESAGVEVTAEMRKETHAMIRKGLGLDAAKPRHEQNKRPANEAGPSNPRKAKVKKPRCPQCGKQHRGACRGKCTKCGKVGHRKEQCKWNFAKAPISSASASQGPSTSAKNPKEPSVSADAVQANAPRPEIPTSANDPARPPHSPGRQPDSPAYVPVGPAYVPFSPTYLQSRSGAWTESPANPVGGRDPSRQPYVADEGTEAPADGSNTQAGSAGAAETSSLAGEATVSNREQPRELSEKQRGKLRQRP